MDGSSFLMFHTKTITETLTCTWTQTETIPLNWTDAAHVQEEKYHFRRLGLFIFSFWQWASGLVHVDISELGFYLHPYQNIPSTLEKILTHKGNNSVLSQTYQTNRCHPVFHLRVRADRSTIYSISWYSQSRRKRLLFTETTMRHTWMSNARSF